MITSFTTRFALTLLLAGYTTVPLWAQQTVHRTTAPKHTTITAKPPIAATRPTTTNRPATASTSAPAQSSQLVTLPANNAQPTPGRYTGGSISTSATRSTGNHSQTAFGSSRNKYLNVGVGLAAYYGAGLPLGASFEVDVKNNISAGGSVDYLHYSGGYTFIYVGARSSYHLGELLNVQNHKFDPYIGATLGFRHTGYDNSYGYYDYGSYNSGLYLGAHLGSRYYFGEKVGGFAEVGYGVSALRIGLTAKF